MVRHGLCWSYCSTCLVIDVVFSSFYRIQHHAYDDGPMRVVQPCQWFVFPPFHHGASTKKICSSLKLVVLPLIHILTLVPFVKYSDVTTKCIVKSSGNKLLASFPGDNLSQSTISDAHNYAIRRKLCSLVCRSIWLTREIMSKLRLICAN